jgi:DNA-binding NtrC family response regulator
VDPQALDRHVQDFVAASMAERVSPSGAPHPLDVWLAVSVPSTVDALVASGRLSSVLGDWLGDRALAIPPLASRAEDIRALVLSRLARLGASLRGEPLGIEDRALARLVDYDWPANDVELEDVLLRATQIAQGPRITARDLDAIGFGGTPGGRGDPVPEHDVQPPVPRRRGRRR